jgi:hypothetical protein
MRCSLMWWKAPKMPRLRSEKYDSEKLMWTMPRTYSPRVWSTVSTSLTHCYGLA